MKKINFEKLLSKASFEKPLWLKPSAWLQHAPFASHLVYSLKPNIFVELGTHYGFSFFSFCQAVQTYQLNTKCFAIDTWEGDEHAGFYDWKIFNEVQAHLSNHYKDFAQLKKKKFNDALNDFDDGIIDVLHIDGRHFYNDVKEDFMNWLPKMSKSGIILLHDTQIKERNFGVHIFFQQLSQIRPSYEFYHGCGLGIIAVGEVIPDSISPFFSLNLNNQLDGTIRDIYERLGENVEDMFNKRYDGSE